MALLDKFKKKEEVIEANVLDTIDKSDWLEVFSACLGKMMVIQTNASKYVVQGRDWNVDFLEGYIAFGNEKYPVQLIGTESNQSNTWNWGWNNVNHLPPQLIKLANEMLVLGYKWKLEPLQIDQFELNDVFNGHNLAIVACGLSNEKYFYYKGPHSGGAVFMAISHFTDKVYTPINIQEFVSLTMQCIEQFPIDHKIFVESLLQWNKTAYQWENNVLIAHFTQALSITFQQKGEHYRISAMNTKK